MRRRLILATAGVALLAGGLVLSSCGGDDGDPAAANATSLDAQRLRAGEIDITIEPLRLDDKGATFAITLDTHAVELSMDLAAAELSVSGTPWPVAGWDGDGPSGHHRSGALRFEAAGPAEGTARLALSGFPEPVAATWELGS